MLMRFRVGEADFWPTLAVIGVIGFVLRLCASVGEISLDEIWSLNLLAGLTSVDQVLWRVSHDNNHFLNSAWLYFTGPDRAVVVQRALSIVLGTASVFAAAAVTQDRGRATQLIAALLFAVSYPMVHYGSEARGYGGLILFSLLAIWALERRLDGRESGIPLAAAILMGFLSHLTMAATVLSLVAWTFLTLFKRGNGLGGAAIGTIRIFLPAFVAVLPLAACIAYGAWTYGFAIGGINQFFFAALFSGYGRIVAFLLAVPSVLYWPFVFLAFAITGVAAWAAPSRRSSLYMIGVVGIPLLLLMMHLPNLKFPRYYTPSVVMLLLCIAELFGRMLSGDGWRRWFAGVALAAYLCSNGVSLWRFLEFGRGSYTEVISEMTVDGDAEYATSNAFRTQMIVDFFTRHSEHKASIVHTRDVCARQPEWFIVEVPDDWPADVEGFPECNLIYDGVLLTQRWGLTGMGWALYRRR